MTPDEIDALAQELGLDEATYWPDREDPVVVWLGWDPGGFHLDSLTPARMYELAMRNSGLC